MQTYTSINFTKKAETCSWHDVLIIFKHIFYAIKAVLDSESIYIH